MGPSIDRGIPEKLRNRLYPVVLELFSRRDFHKVNLREIAATAAVSTGTIYKHFASKEDLLFTVLDEKIAAAKKRGDIDPTVKPRLFADIYYMMCYRQIHNWYYHGRQWRLADAGAEHFKLAWKMLAPV